MRILGIVNINDNKPFIIACIPAYKEEMNIGCVVQLTRKYVDKVLVCDDGSGDMTSEIAEDSGAIVIHHERNLGKGAALRTLFNYAKDMEPDIVVMLDGDGQHDPREIPNLVEPIVDGVADMVVGSRYLVEYSLKAPLYRRMGLILINVFSRRSCNNVARDTQSGFKAFSSKALEVVMRGKADGYGIETEQLTLAMKNDLRIVEVPVNIRYNGIGKTSKKNPILQGSEMIGTALRLIIDKRRKRS